jgi:hypothetical protein
MVGSLVSNESERMWKEVAVAYLKLLDRLLPAETEENN